MNIIENKTSFTIKGKELIFNNLFVTYGDKSLLCSNIDRVKYGSIQMYINGIKANKIYEFFLIDKNEQYIKIQFQKLWIKTIDGEILYQNIIDVLWINVTSKIVDKMLIDLQKGKIVQIGKLGLTKKGINIKVWRWFKFKYEEVFIPWKSCLKQVVGGGIIISSKDNKRDKCKEDFLKVWNLNALHSTLNFLWEEGRCYKLEDGTLKYKID